MGYWYHSVLLVELESFEYSPCISGLHWCKSRRRSKAGRRCRHSTSIFLVRCKLSDREHVGEALPRRRHRRERREPLVRESTENGLDRFPPRLPGPASFLLLEWFDPLKGDRKMASLLLMLAQPYLFVSEGSWETFSIYFPNLSLASMFAS